MIKYILILLLHSLISNVLSEINSNQDTYVNALQNSHLTANNNNNNNGPAVDRDDFGIQSSLGTHQNGYDYPLPIQPHANYGPPAPVYGPPKPIYGPPPSFYPHNPPGFYHPRDEHWFFDKFKFKLDLFTFGKILLKLIIFKKIVKFIGLICLLLFLPKLKNLLPETEDDGSMEMRSYNDKENLNERINEVTNFALTAIDTFSKKNKDCGRDQIWCRFQRVFDQVDKKYSYDQIVKLYIPNASVNTN